MSARLIALPTHTDVRGSLTVGEKDPFEVKRAFWVYDMRDWRGGHAHWLCHQLIIAIHGALEVIVEGERFWLTKPSVGLYVPPKNKVDFYGPGVALVLCSEHYDEADYVH